MEIFKLLMLKELKFNSKLSKTYQDLSQIDMEKIINLAKIGFSQIKKAEYRVNIIIEECIKNGIEIIGYFDEQYPNEIKGLKDAQLVLFKKGNLNQLPKIAVVGTRYPTSLGINFAKEITNYLIKNNISIVSGLARGVDTIAHQVCVNNLMPTIAILPSNLVDIYPRGNKKLAEQIIDAKGCLISEYSPLDEIKKYYFVKRDRIQAIFSQAVLVVETTKDGGTMHTAKYAQNYNIDLLCLKFPQGRVKHDFISGNDFLLNNQNTISIEKISDLTSYLEMKNLRK